MNPLLLSAGISALGGLFGGGAARGARKKAAQYQTTGLNYLNGSAALLPRYNHLAQGSEASYTQFAPQARDATQQFANYLKQDPYTDTVDTAYLNNATQGATTDYKAAAARSAATLAQRGITGSNVSAGAALYNNNALAANTAAARNDLALRKVQERQQRFAALTRLLTGATDSAENSLQDNLGRMDSTNRYLAGSYADMAAQQQAQAQAQAAGTADMFGGLGDLAAILGTPGKKRFKPLNGSLMGAPPSFIGL